MLAYCAKAADRLKYAETEATKAVTDVPVYVVSLIESQAVGLKNLLLLGSFPKSGYAMTVTG
jgi:hypothetical protein